MLQSAPKPPVTGGSLCARRAATRGAVALARNIQLRDAVILCRRGAYPAAAGEAKYVSAARGCVHTRGGDGARAQGSNATCDARRHYQLGEAAMPLLAFS